MAQEREIKKEQFQNNKLKKEARVQIMMEAQKKEEEDLINEFENQD